MATSRTLIVAGAGIGGLTAALALAHRGHRVVVVEQSEKLSDAGAGIQLSPNATRILATFGVTSRLAPLAVTPEGLSIRRAKTGREIAFIPLGSQMEFRFGAPYWMVHRGDLQSALADAVHHHPDIVLKLATRLDDLAIHAHGITAQLREGGSIHDERAIGLIGADGLWSLTREKLGDTSKPRFRNRTAWRAMLPASSVPEDFRRPAIQLWLGPNAHLVHYPVRGGAFINVVAIVRDRWNQAGWSAPGQRNDLLRHFPVSAWARPARDLLQIPENWHKWALFDRSGSGYAGRGPMTLLGDAAHPVLPFLAQGAAMAIEDAAVLAACLASPAADLQTGMRRYEALRHGRVLKIQRAARATGRIYHLSGMRAIARDVGMQLLGGKRLLARYDWLYDWRPD